MLCVRAGYPPRQEMSVPRARARFAMRKGSGRRRHKSQVPFLCAVFLDESCCHWKATILEIGRIWGFLRSLVVGALALQQDGYGRIGE